MTDSNNDCFVIVIGESGSGKSTFINYVANAFYQKPSLNSLQVVIPNEHYPTCSSSKWKHNERALNDPTLSKTVNWQRYSFPSPPGKNSLVFIDTPGLGDTSGYLQDNENVDMIFETIKSLQQISAIILLINGTIARITSNVTNVLTRFRQFFPDSVYANMIVVFTNCQKYNVSFQQDSLSLPSTCRFFYMQNSAYCQTPQMINVHRSGFEQDWKESIATMRAIINYLLQLQPQATKAFADLDDERYRLQAFLHETYLMILEMDQLETELESLKRVADLGEENIQKRLQKSQTYVLTSVSTDYNNIICAQCNRICHRNCKLNEVSCGGNNPIATCSKMEDGCCIKCQCSIDSHYYYFKDIVKQTRSTIDSVVQAKQRLRIEREDHALSVHKYNSVDAVKNQVQKRFDRQYAQIRQTCMNLKTSCRNINIAQELTNFIRILNQGQSQLRAPLVISRLNYLIHELEHIVLDCEQISKNNGNDNLLRSSRIEASSLVSPTVPPPVPPPIPRRQSIKQPTSVMPPTYYQPDQVPEQSPTPVTSQISPIQLQRYSAYSTERLIGAHEELVRLNSDYAKRTLSELQQRAKGKSVGPLNSFELVQFANYYADWRHHDTNGLQEEYTALFDKIDLDINHDASNLDCAEKDDLLKIAALFLLISSVT